MNILRKQLLCKTTAIHKFNGRFYSKAQYEDYIKEIAALASGKVDLQLCNKTGVAEVILDNPKCMNAISGSMMTRLNGIVDELEKWKEGKVVILRGANGQFCTGGDIRHFVPKIDTPLKGAMMSEYMQGILLKFKRLPFINVAWLQGKVLGGGAELAVACDIRLIEQNAKIGFVNTRMGVTTGFGGGQNLVSLLGYRSALRILVAHRLLTANEALTCGLVDAILGDSERCLDWLEKENLLNLHYTLIQGIKSMTLHASEMPAQDALRHERDVFQKFWQGKFHREAIEGNVKH